MSRDLFFFGIYWSVAKNLKGNRWRSVEESHDSAFESLRELSNLGLRVQISGQCRAVLREDVARFVNLYIFSHVRISDEAVGRFIHLCVHLIGDDYLERFFRRSAPCC